MLGDFWQELLGSVGSLLNTLTQSRQQREYVFVDSNGMPPLGLGDDVPAPSTQAAPPMWVQAKAQLETLQKADPNFLEATFLSQATKTYSAVLAAEGAMSADAIASAVTPAFLDHFKQRIQGWHDAGLTRVVSDVNLDPPTTFKANIGGDVQCITVRFTGSAKRFTKDDVTNLVSEGSAQADSFTEFATFTRPAGSTTPKSTSDGGAIHCPSCGAPVDAGALRCSFCGAPISGSGGTWLLDHTSVSAYT
jgi:predicted lipid-binding transport protein (Tim44 family)